MCYIHWVLQVIIPLFKKSVMEAIHQGDIGVNKILDISLIMVCDNVGTKCTSNHKMLNILSSVKDICFLLVT